MMPAERQIRAARQTSGRKSGRTAKTDQLSDETKPL